MKKLLFLFTTLLLISCSSDENEESTQTFLEKYDGYIFESTLDDNGYIQVSRVEFIEDGKKWKVFNEEIEPNGDSYSFCETHFLDGITEFQENNFRIESTIIENTHDLLKIRAKTFDYNFDPIVPNLFESDYQIIDEQLIITSYYDVGFDDVEELDGVYDGSEVSYMRLSNISSSELCNPTLN